MTIYIHHQIKIKGFNEKQSVLLMSIIKKLVSFVVDDKKFTVYKEQVSYNQYVQLSKELYHFSNSW